MPPSHPTPGVLLVTMAPNPTLPLSKFHDWYNNEHGPGRLRLPFCKNGFRYRANDHAQGTYSPENPEWMAIYDIEDMDWLTKDVYTRLRQAPVQSQRERDTMAQIKVDRRFWDLAGEWKCDSFPVLEDVSREGEGNVMVSVLLTLHPDDNSKNETELKNWYEQEHVPLLQKVPGWRRTRRFVTSYLDLEAGRAKQFLALHEYAPENGLAGAEFKAATSTKWNNEMYENVISSKTRRVYDLYYTFGAAPRDLTSLSDSSTIPFEATDTLTKTTPSHASPTTTPTISSFVTTPDNVVLPYTLTSLPSTPLTAPLLLCIPSILTTSQIYNNPTFLSPLLSSGFRILLFDPRGRSSLPTASQSPITITTLSSDIIALLDALRVQKTYLLGVSLGGATALHTALTYPHRVEAFVACDTNAVAPPGNPKAWGERIAMAEQEAAKSDTNGEGIVGTSLAEITVRRWFTEPSYADPETLSRITQVKDMVSTNSLPGFKAAVNALYAYDFRPQMRGFKGKGAFLVGEKDGVLPETMKGMAEALGEKGTVLGTIGGAGHLPMVERPQETGEWVKGYFEGGK
ncbi:alpha/beta hydrolase-like protein [Dendryphion nanum]|uniref:Alpha/beta hydrolase-like protein n=1 Tax=Dendryphion nanum TaxID=256645 RepID=A0A9P9D4Y9_9PLEO|nr:alpha/beta hydrolase-like protein [Dendryphion nanum]